MSAMRERHESIADALSGKRIDTLMECVQIAITGRDASGKPLAIHNASEVCAWLIQQLADQATGCCALLT